VVASINDFTDEIEKDILVTEILDPKDIMTSVVKNVRIAIDVNGPFHFPRNSFDLLGKDIL